MVIIIKSDKLRLGNEKLFFFSSKDERLTLFNYYISILVINQTSTLGYFSFLVNKNNLQHFLII